MLNSTKVWDKVEIEMRGLEPGARMPPKAHSATLFSIILSGSARATLGERHFRLRKGQQIWMPPDMELAMQAGSGGIEFWHLRFRNGLWAPQAQADQEVVEAMSLMDRKSRHIQGNFHLTPQSRQRLLQTCESMHQLTTATRKTKNRLFGAMMKAHATTVIATLLTDKKVRQIPESEPESLVSIEAKKRVAPALARMEHTRGLRDVENSIPEMARICHLAPSRFHSLFVQATGTSPNRYLTRKRISLACSYLSRTDRKVIDIAYDVGFGSPSRFYTAFKRVTGVTPGQWRDLHQSQVL